MKNEMIRKIFREQMVTWLRAQVLFHGPAQGPDSTQQIRLAGYAGYLAF